ncbi:MAG: DUF2851 family protein, partial [Chloroflexi bacterium]|nr:DUF2851 family protein [Chloroflexota bacterium]
MVTAPARTVEPTSAVKTHTGHPAFILEIGPEAILHAAWRMTGSGEAVVRSRQGELYRVIYVGRPSDGAGPDFRDAILQHPDGTVLKGDIEIHVRASGWRSHGHDTDRRYNGVIFHVASAGEGPVRSAGGARIPLLILSAPKFASPATPPKEAIASGNPGAVPDTGECAERSSAEPRVRQSGSLTGLEAPDRATGEGDLANLLPEMTPDEAGDLRFLAKSSGMQIALSSRPAEDVLWGSVLECLGYSRNRKGFRQLADRVPWTALGAACRVTATNREDIEMVLLWAAGLAARPAANTRAGRIATSLQPIPGARPAWVKAAGRPHNRPARRIAAAAVLAHRWLPAGPRRSLEDLLAGVTGPGDLARNLVVGSPVPGGQSLLGDGRAREIVVNAVLPALHAIAFLEQRWALAERAFALYRDHPR